MGLSTLFACFLAVCSTLAAPTAPAKYCDTTTTICYSQFTTTNNIAFRIAIPDTATSAPFDVLVQIVAPKSVGWAGIAWGGQMTYNPLTVAWPNGAAATVSSRRATYVFLLLPSSAPLADPRWFRR
ncbi:hypothetical protein DL546_001394 [Coniochaeta pulveracea]|uniref:Cellobiose dehydrogenase-like cytochrome domain-containing protein n=1 Tax=Coniochaeta pulveracea TaxID=177199 RepID=A0A420Y0J3_9PEZI|nr:hypothetical protein DL546_001394 [Coniochaeta pulveracea]